MVARYSMFAFMVLLCGLCCVVSKPQCVKDYGDLRTSEAKPVFELQGLKGFKYLQTSLILKDCYGKGTTVHRGNWWWWRKSEGDYITVALAYTVNTTYHAYTVWIDRTNVFQINTTYECGTFAGFRFRVAGKGTRACNLSWEEDTRTQDTRTQDTRTQDTIIEPRTPDPIDNETTYFIVLLIGIILLALLHIYLFYRLTQYSLTKYRLHLNTI